MRPIVKLWEICKFQNWFAFKSELFKAKWEPILRISNIQKDNISDEKLVFFDLNDYDNLDTYIVNPWELVIAMSWATTWKIAINNTNKKYYLNQRVWKFSFDNDITKEYCHYFLWTKVEENLNKAAWAAIQNLSSKQILDIQIPLPPLETQKAIVAKLDQIFAELDQTKSEIQKNLDNTDELWKSALNQAFQGDWEMKKLGEVCEASIWLTYKPENVTDTWIIVLRSSNIKDRELDFDDIVRVNIDVKEELKVKEWDILMCARNWSKRLVGKSALIKSLNEEMTYWTFMMIIRSKYNKYLQYFFESDRFFGQIRTDNGPMINQITKYMIVDVVAPIPPLSEQEKIVEHLDQVSKEVKALKSQYQSQLDNLEELKKSVLDKAFKWELGE